MIESTENFTTALLRWFDAVGRDLPWRRTAERSTLTPWHVLVSEVMLQQTQVARVREHWPNFVERWPTPEALAEDPLAELLVAWKGLGYYRRARALHETARVVVTQHSGVLPDDLDGLLALPGIGPYTARAVLAFAYDAPVAPVDVNIARVLARAVGGAPLRPAAAQRLADERCERSAPGRWSSALMDLGALVCTARRPSCGACPVRANCAWVRAGGPDVTPDPARSGAGRSRPQEAFAGSDRWHRGRLLDALRAGALAEDATAQAAGLDDDHSRLERIVAGLIRDGLAEKDEPGLRLAGTRPPVDPAEARA